MKFHRKKILKPIGVILIILTTLLSMELAGQIAYKLTHQGKWLLCSDKVDKHLFMEHPYLVGVPKPSVSVKNKKHITISHNSLGYRGREIAIDKGINIKRIVVLGGSSTYCVGVSDNETWPYFLEYYLGKGWEVINLGVPGYSTVENLIQTAFNISELSPDIAIYYEGWNDIRNIHINNLKSDYSDFHGKSQYYNLDLHRLNIGERFVIILSVNRLLLKIFNNNTKRELNNKQPSDKAFSREIDAYALSLYHRNLESIIALCKRFQIRPIMIPQILNSDKLVSDKPYGWIPFLKDKDVIHMLLSYNIEMRDVAYAEKAGFINNVLGADFATSDFIDNGHFSAEGNKKFAKIVADYVLAQRY